MKWPFQYWIGWASALLVVVYFLAFGIGLLLCSCTTARLPEPTKPLKVEITAMPVREVTCWMPEIPRAPELEAMDFEDSDVISRTMIHRYQYSEMTQWALEMQQWAEEVQKCVNEIRGVEP